MSLSIHTGTPINSESPAAWSQALKECGDMLVAYAGCILYEVDVDAGTEYDAVYYAGGTRWIRLVSTAYTQSQASVTIAEGYAETETGFHALASVTNTITLSSSDNPIPRIRVANRGDAWELDFGGSAVSGGYFHLRGVNLRSSLSGSTSVSLGLYWGSGETYSQYAPFPSIDTLVFDRVEYPVVASYDSDLYTAVPVGKIMLFPSLISCAYQNDLGATTIAKKQPYAVSSENIVPIRPFTEFMVGREKFVSLGHLAIAST